MALGFAVILSFVVLKKSSGSDKMKEIAGYVNVPVFMSSLLQVPFAQQLIGPDKVVGILVARQEQLRPEHLENVGVKPGSNYIVTGAEDDETGEGETGEEETGEGWSAIPASSRGG